MKLYHYIMLISSIVVSACSADLDPELIDTTNEEIEQTRAINMKTCSKCGAQYNSDIYTKCPYGCQDENVYGYHCSICKKPVSGKNGSCNNCGDNPNRKNIPCQSLTCICKKGTSSNHNSDDGRRRTVVLTYSHATGTFNDAVDAFKKACNVKQWKARFEPCLPFEDYDLVFNIYDIEFMASAYYFEVEKIVFSFSEIYIYGTGSNMNEFIKYLIDFSSEAGVYYHMH